MWLQGLGAGCGSRDWVLGMAPGAGCWVWLQGLAAECSSRGWVLGAKYSSRVWVLGVGCGSRGWGFVAREAQSGPSSTCLMASAPPPPATSGGSVTVASVCQTAQSRGMGSSAHDDSGILVCSPLS